MPATACQTVRGLDQELSPLCQLNATTSGCLPSLRGSECPGPGGQAPPNGLPFPRILTSPQHQPSYLLLFPSPISGTAPPSSPSPSWRLCLVLHTAPDPSTPPKQGSGHVLSSQPPEHLSSIHPLPSLRPRPARVWPSSCSAQVPASASSLLSQPPVLPLCRGLAKAQT